MSKFCPNCGAELDDAAMFCASCGAPQPGAEQTSQSQQDQFQQNQQQFNQQQNQQQSQGGADLNLAAINKRDIVVAIILSIVTCGIYALVWMAKLNDEMYRVFDEPVQTSGGMVILLSIITCNIYALVWYYRMGERTDRLKGYPGNTNVLYLILGFFGLGIVNLAIMQDALNKCAEQ